MSETTCPTCRGSRVIGGDISGVSSLDCPRCKGTGSIDGEETSFSKLMQVYDQRRPWTLGKWLSSFAIGLVFALIWSFVFIQCVSE